MQKCGFFTKVRTIFCMFFLSQLVNQHSGNRKHNASKYKSKKDRKKERKNRLDRLENLTGFQHLILFIGMFCPWEAVFS